MALNWVWQTILIFIVGIFILRVGGRKSISQMTISQTIVMIGLGYLLIQPVSGISSIEDVKYATIEVSGQIGYELKDNKKPLTQGEFMKIVNDNISVEKNEP